MPPTTFTSSSRPGMLPSTLFQLAKATHQVSISTLKTNGYSTTSSAAAEAIAEVDENGTGDVAAIGVDTVDVPVAYNGGLEAGDSAADGEVAELMTKPVDDFADDVSEHAKGDTPPPQRHLSLATKVRALRQAVSRGKEWREKIALKVRPSNASEKTDEEKEKEKGENGHNTDAEIVAEEEKADVDGQPAIVVHHE